MALTQAPAELLNLDSGITISTADNLTQLTLTSTDADASPGPQLDMVRDSASPADSDVLGRIRFRGDNDAGEVTTMVYLQTYLHDASDGTEDGGLDLFARQGGTLNRRITINTSGEICFNEDSADIDFRVESNGNANMLFVDGGNDVVGIGTNTMSSYHTDFNDLVVDGGTNSGITIVSGTTGDGTIAFSDGTTGDQQYRGFLQYTHSSDVLKFGTAGSERMRIDSSGNVFINRTSGSFNADGTLIGASSGSYMYIERSAGTSNAVIYVHRRNGDGNLMQFYESNSQEGSIEVSGSTILYNGFCGTHDSSGSGVSLSTPVGTVLSTVDEEHKTKHAKVKVSDTASDKRVYGVLQLYKAEETDDTENTKAAHAVVAAVGIASVRVTGACAGGDLLESAGDGTAKVQSDDVIRSSTLGKVTIGNSNAEEKLVSCVMYCG